MLIEETLHIFDTLSDHDQRAFISPLLQLEYHGFPLLFDLIQNSLILKFLGGLLSHLFELLWLLPELELEIMAQS